MKRTDVLEGYKLSPQQERMWGEWEEEYGAECELRMEGGVEWELMGEAMEGVIGREEALRTRYVEEEGGEKWQVIEEEMGGSFGVVDLEGMGERKRACWEEVKREGREKKWEKERGPVVRAIGGKLEEGKEERLWLRMGGLSGDGKAMENLVGEMVEGYGKGREWGKERKRGIRYVQYAEWANGLREEEGEGGGKYWRGRKQRQAEGEREKGYEWRVERWKLSEEVKGELRGEREGLAGFVMGSWQTLQWRLSGEGEQEAGYLCEGRKYEELEGAIGLYSRWVPVWSGIGKDYGFGEVVEEAGEEIRQGEAWQEYYEREGGARGRWKTGVELERRRKRWEGGGVQFEQVEERNCTERMELRLKVKWDEEGEAEAELHYNGKAYEREEIVRLMRQWEEIVRSAVEQPGAMARELRLLSEEERREILEGWRGEQREYGRGGVVQRMEEMGKREPERVAVVMGERRVSYGEMVRRGGEIGRKLREWGVGKEGRVGVGMGRKVEMMMAVVGIWKAGGAYVPLEPGSPEERLKYVLEDAGVEIVVADRETAGEYRRLGVEVLEVGEEEEAGARGEEEGVEVEEENLAYVMYTSGSTGKPKGVGVTHGGLWNYLMWIGEGYGEGEWRTLVHTAVSFDLTVTGMWGPLVRGGQVELLGEGVGVEGLREALEREQGWTHVKMTPGQMDSLGVEGLGQWAGGSGVLILGGEALQGESLRWWQEQFPESRIYNEYGPTEAVVGCSVQEVVGAQEGAVAIGRPIANTRVYVLDGEMEPVPMGVKGELYIGGAGLARGYWGKAELTAERFVPDPYGEQGERLYRTGDVARYRADGAIEYVGRRDEQVKIRGYRIELGEIEEALRSHAGVREAAVAVREEGGHKRLVAYVVCDPQRRVKPGELRRYVEKKLPEYMVPAAWVSLAALPLTRQGKIDRAALPEPERNRPELEESYVAPRSFAEEVLAAIWADVLGLEQVGIHDNFFALGGDSIRSIRVRSRAQQRGIDITYEQLFRRQTIAQLVKEVEQGGGGSTLPLVQPGDLLGSQDRSKLSPDIEDAYPLTRLQSGMVFHSEYSPESAVYRDTHSFHLKIRLDLNELRQAVQQAIDRHAALRTSFDLIHYSEPVQLVHRRIDAVIDFTDVQGAGSDQERQISEWMEEDRIRVYDWSVAPLARFHVHKRAEDAFQFTMSFHHAILDGWSAASLLTELFNTYVARITGSPVEPAEPLNLSYRDFVAAEQAALRNEESRRYWAGVIAQAEGGSFLQANPDSAQASARSGSDGMVVPISNEVSGGLRRLARVLSVPLKSVLLAAHIKVIGFNMGGSEAITGIVCNGRPEQDGGDRMLGLFLNTLPLNVPLQATDWSTLVQAAFQAEMSAISHRRFPLQELQRGGRRLFEAVFNYMHYHIYQSLTGVSDVQILGYMGYEETNFPLTANFSLDPVSQQIQLMLNYHPAAVAESQIKRLCRQYETALEHLAINPGARHNEASLMSGEEREEIVRGWNGTREERREGTVLDWIEAKAEERSGKVAVRDEQEELSYGELEERANRLGRYLRKRGVREESRVGIWMERGVGLMVGLLGIWKAGGAYVPLDRSYPRERVEYMVKDAGVEVVVSDGGMEWLKGIGGEVEVEVVNVEEREEEIGRESGERMERRVEGENAAYVIYTSGSTGKPKGAVNTQSGIANRLEWMQRAYGMGEGDRVLQKTTMSFDVSVWEFFWPLMSGAELVMARPGGQQDSRYLVEVMEREGITTVHFVPSMLGAWLEEEGVKGLRKLKRVVCSGEALSRELQEKFYARVEGAELDNLYGPTEAAVDVSYWKCEAGREVAIGRPIANTQLYVLDGEMEPVPVGVKGELYIGGAGLARGYWGKAELTAERFVPDPYGEQGERLYRTGDVARYRADGAIEYVGRRDEQVKIRGYRIELGEVEEALRSHAGVREAAVVVREEGGHKRLVAYVSGEGLPKGSGWREYLGERLPEYMLPSVYVELERMPLTANGKLDRRALPSMSVPQSAYTAPRNDIETEIAGIWAEIIGLAQVGVHDNFLEIGGHSLTATRVVSRIRDTFRIELPLRRLFDTPTIAELAIIVVEAQRTKPAISPAQTSLTAHATENLDELLEELAALEDEQIQELLSAKAVAVN